MSQSLSIQVSIPVTAATDMAVLQQILALSAELAGVPTVQPLPVQQSMKVSKPAPISPAEAAPIPQQPVAMKSVAEVTQPAAQAGEQPVKRRPGRPPGSLGVKRQQQEAVAPPAAPQATAPVGNGAIPIPRPVPQNPAMPSSQPPAEVVAEGDVGVTDLENIWQAAVAHDPQAAHGLMRATQWPSGEGKKTWFSPKQVPAPFVTRMYSELMALLPTV